MIYIAIPTITPRLERCACMAIAATTPEPFRIIVSRGKQHGESLDAAFRTLPDDAEWFFTMDDDAAPLKPGWLSWMLKQMGGIDYLTFGQNMVVGAVYRVAELRALGRGFACTQEPGETFRYALSGAHVPRDRGPWWLTNCEAYRDEAGDLVFGHLGGGTIGHTWHHKGKLYPRIPTWLWPVLVRRHLRRNGS